MSTKPTAENVIAAAIEMRDKLEARIEALATIHDNELDDYVNGVSGGDPAYWVDSAEEYGVAVGEQRALDRLIARFEQELKYGE